MATLYSYGDNNKIHVCRTMIMSSTSKLHITYVSDKKMKNQINAKYIRIHVYEYTGDLFASNLPCRDRKSKFISKSEKKLGGDGEQGSLTLALPPHSHQDHAQSLLGPSFHDPRTWKVAYTVDVSHLLWAGSGIYGVRYLRTISCGVMFFF